ncbi:hypothetical protein [Swingsia samuiensis]|uniref:Uncharacterized protein n=1 Tax=Swingsia samuiensis TaxID=1293412 RepID=A0A4Y6UMD0_9PROT|nr:hypothetical protein [Swingsia samuiensis]QDH17556.1 hypothetical protein E3D00_08270 [Swingsia samuiensis]
MDIQTVEQTYNQLVQQSQQSAQALQNLANKMQSAAQNGDMQAREWSLDLRELALSFQAEQQQVANLLQQLHSAMENASNMQQGYAQQPQAPVQVVEQQQQPASGNFLSNILNSGFARSVEAGAGFGIGNDLIKEIF